VTRQRRSSPGRAAYQATMSVAAPYLGGLHLEHLS
jgi:hypothetical protein